MKTQKDGNWSKKRIINLKKCSLCKSTKIDLTFSILLPMYLPKHYVRTEEK